MTNEQYLEKIQNSIKTIDDGMTQFGKKVNEYFNWYYPITFSTMGTIPYDLDLDARMRGGNYVEDDILTKLNEIEGIVTWSPYWLDSSSYPNLNTGSNFFDGIQGVTWEQKNDGNYKLTISRFANASGGYSINSVVGSIIIPTHYNGADVTELGDIEMGWKLQDLETPKIWIPNTVKTIGNLSCYEETDDKGIVIMSSLPKIYYCNTPWVGESWDNVEFNQKADFTVEELGWETRNIYVNTHIIDG